MGAQRPDRSLPPAPHRRRLTDARRRRAAARGGARGGRPRGRGGGGPRRTRHRSRRCATSTSRATTPRLATSRVGRPSRSRPSRATGPRARRDDGDNVHRRDPRRATGGAGAPPDDGRARRGRAGRRRLPRHRRLRRRVRAGTYPRHPAGGVEHRRRCDRDGAERGRAGRGDPVRGLRLPGVQPVDLRGRALALPLGRRLGLPDRGAHAVRGGHPGCALPLAVARGVPRARAGPEGRGALDAVRREGAAQGGDSRPRPGDLLRAQARLPARAGRGSRGGLRGPDRPRPRCAARATT